EPTPETFLAISPPPSDWPPARVQSFFREYNESMLADLTVHEGMPGHYLQLMHSNTYRSKLRAVLGSGPFIEGWAVYSEWLMASKGFGGAKVRIQQQKMILRMATNALLDHGIHAGDMDERQAMDLMTREAFQEEGEAAGKWNRARLTSAQLTTYFYGYSEMMKLREAARKAPGFAERTYHHRLLSHGSPGKPYLPRLMESHGGCARPRGTPPLAGCARSTVSGCAPFARRCWPQCSPRFLQPQRTRKRRSCRTRTRPSRGPSPASTPRSSRSTSCRRTPRAGESGSPERPAPGQSSRRRDTSSPTTTSSVGPRRSGWSCPRGRSSRPRWSGPTR